MSSSFANSEEGRPVLQRRHSDSSRGDSVSSHTSRRNSLGSVENSQKTSSFESSRRSSLPPTASPMHQAVPPSPGVRETVVTFDTGRRDSFTSLNSEITNFTKRSGLTRHSRISGASSSIYQYDFMVDDGTDLQESHWMYSQARWLGKCGILRKTGESFFENCKPQTHFFSR